jgi:hypothetical protein
MSLSEKTKTILTKFNIHGFISDEDLTFYLYELNRCYKFLLALEGYQLATNAIRMEINRFESIQMSRQYKNQ